MFRISNVGIKSLYTLLVVCMGFSTIVEQFAGKEFAAAHIYGSWWFMGLWAAVVGCSVALLVAKRVFRRPAVLLLHASFVVILLGALVTHFTSEEGTIHLREGEWATAFMDKDSVPANLPFQMQLTDFDLQYYPGTDAIMDYQAQVNVCTKEGDWPMTISMNNIGRAAGYRFYQSSYDSDLQGTILLVAHDPYGIAITYAGYVLLLIALLWTLASRQTQLRHLYRLATQPAVACLLFFGLPTAASAEMRPSLTPVSQEIAAEMGQLPVLYNGRICPLNTAATDLVTKLCGRSSWQGHQADEIFLGWMIYYSEWEQQPLIQVKNREVQKLLGINDRWACVSDFYDSNHTYKLSGKANDLHYDESVRKALREADEKIQVIMMFYHGEMLRLFPLPDEGGLLRWHSPGSTELPKGVGEAEFQFINHAMDEVVKATLAHDVAGAKSMISRIRAYQKDKAGVVLPSAARLQMEVAYNQLHSSRWVVILSLVLSFLFCFLAFGQRVRAWVGRLHVLYLVLLFVFLSVMLALRWVVGGHVPLSNGFETMLFMAWAVLLFTLVLMRRMPVLKALGPVVASLCLLVAMMAGSSPQVTQLMPVLQSPLLSIHVALVMMAYSLFAIIMLLAVRCLCLRSQQAGSEFERMTALSRLLLYPAVSLLALGIFVGAVWANVSWGSYWSWDPKETWALITLMVYAIPLHQASLPTLQRPRTYHWFVLLSFLTILMTYFGVNYFLRGMHSYA